jgi:hypothetical protein
MGKEIGSNLSWHQEKKNKRRTILQVFLFHFSFFNFAGNGDPAAQLCFISLDLLS